MGAVVMLVGLAWAHTAWPHQFAPALLELKETQADRVEVLWKQPAMRVQGSRLQPVLPVDCEGVGKPHVSQVGTAVQATWQIECAGGLAGRSLGVEGISTSRADVLLRVALANGTVISQVLTAAEPSYQIDAQPGRANVLHDYFVLGVEHILSGWDHLAFVLGLVLLVGPGRNLIWTITAFTLGHSVTLVAATLGLIAVPQAAVEAFIALSIYVLAIEIFRQRAGKKGLLIRLPWLAAATFGLLHGLGFAGALSEAGLPAGEIPAALFAFNIGIETGQLAFVLVLWIGMLLLRRAPTLPAWVTQMPAYVVGTLGIFWFLERAFAYGATLLRV